MVKFADRIAAEFPPNVRMPDELRQLCDFQDRSGGYISGHMELGPQGEGLKAWFGPGSDAAQQLAGFAAGPDGSSLALWLYAGSDSAPAPVVHLGSEGDRLIVLAANMREFLMLFGIGYSELGHDDLSEPPENPESAAKLRDWLLSEFQITTPKTGVEIVNNARSAHPDFEQWVLAKLGH